MLPRRTALLTLLVLALGSATAPAAPSRSPLEVRPGQRVSLSVAPHGARSCRLDAEGRRARVGARGALRVTFSFRTAGDARPGLHRVTIRCTGRQARRVAIRVAGRRGAGRLIAGPIALRIVRQAGGAGAGGGPAEQRTASTPLTDAEALARAGAEWADRGKHILASFAGTGQCTEWAARKRPDVIERVYVRLWANDLLGVQPGSAAARWNGKDWDDAARAGGLPVTATPSPGALAVFEPGVLGAGAGTGHVAYVESVGPDGSFTLSEMNAPVLGAVSRRTLSAAAAATPGLSFIP